MTPHERLLDQVRKAQEEMAKWPKSWREREGIKPELDLTTVRKKS